MHSNNHMTAKTIGMKRWFSVVDIPAIFGCLEQLNRDAALIVDIGGSVTHNILAFEDEQVKPMRGKLCLLDLYV